MVVAYRMAREVPRTLLSLSRRYQRGIASVEYEVLVIDNGSPEPLSPSVVDKADGHYRFYRVEDASPSPAQAVNLGVSMARGRHVGLIADGARMVTPGVIANGLDALRLHERAIVTTMAWHLGDEHQSISIAKGYGPAQEDRLLDGIGWPGDGYRLFEISSLAGANPGGFFGEVNESCCLLLRKTLWDEVGGMDERFDHPGGGLVSLDLFTRLLALPQSQLVVLLGEGSFHQVHGGASTSPGADHGAWHARYEALRGVPYTKPTVAPLYWGTMPDAARRWICPSVQA